ncbi:MAG TPA: glycine cleavage T C-terminal barrel domain-containing protein [Longimicrobiales bacterium]|nr:glycine cleavage T C-terminal barrel domain-containing protein [Longimicrobiales bacterium]
MSHAYAAAHRGAIAVERADRTFLRVHGRDPVRMLQGLITNDLAGAPAGRAVFAAVLTPKGKMVAEVRIVRRGDELLLETAATARDGLVAHLKKFVPPLFARFDDASETWRMLGVYGPDAARVLRAAGIETAALAREDDAMEDDVVVCIATSYAGVPGFDLVLPAAAFDAVRARVVEAGAVPADADVVEVLRVEAGSPRWGAELLDTTIPLEAGLRTRAISETKGCYTGQEVIIRILHRGHVNWLLRGMLLGEVAPPAPGTELQNADGKRVARITSAVRSARFGQTIALAYVRREVDAGATLTLDGATVRVVALPFDGGGSRDG